ncbi:nuclear transport factor 2 family protein [Hyphococcus flavus]|uniref:Nuclear transport factor 2 family protein n=1 Tax=Hyphococcus flavus TaxID=1866326 RepID=A0AAE9ZIP0_9PROT|nr:nuclear transport factor 2 family protein [Hyphococcus flavus]WDI31716.1 nuclear transport factor 2 family protein [Hyphococcus flavus]
MMRVFIIALNVLFLASCSEAQAPRPDFNAAVKAHLAAINAKDLEAYAPTVTGRNDLMIIFPEGEVIETTDDVIGFHREWFQDENWRMDIETVKLMEGEDMSAALLKYDYRDTPEGEPRSSWLLLLFQLEGGEWRLIHDQNTRITQTTENE